MELSLVNTDAPWAHNFALLVLPFNQRIVNKRVQHCHQRVFILAQQAHSDLARNAKDS